MDTTNYNCLFALCTFKGEINLIIVMINYIIRKDDIII